MDLATLENVYDNLKTEYIARKIRRDQLIAEKNELEDRLEIVKEQKELKSKTAELLNKVGDYARNQAKINLETMVTNALQFIFREDVRFEIDIEKKRGRPEAEFFIVSTYGNKVVRTKPQDSRGGGVIDIISITLRIALAECFNITGPLILDEPAKHLSSQYVPALSEFLKRISTEFGRQIIMVTHNETLAECGDLCYEVRIRNGVSQIILVPRLSETEIDA